MFKVQISCKFSKELGYFLNAARYYYYKWARKMSFDLELPKLRQFWSSKSHCHLFYFQLLFQHSGQTFKYQSCHHNKPPACPYGILKYLKMFNNFSHRKCCEGEILLHTETKSWSWNHTVNTVPIRVEEAEGRLSCFLNLIYKDQISLCWKLKSIKIECVMVKRIFYLLWCLLHETLIVWNHSYKI